MKIALFAISVLAISGCKKDVNPGQGQSGNTTKVLPVVNTHNVQNLTLNSVILGGVIISNGSAAVTEQGIVISTSPMPTISNTPDRFKMNKDAGNNFSSKIRGHLPNTTFYVRAYAISADGVGYGNQIIYNSPVEKRWPGQRILSTQQEVIDFGALGYNRVQWLIITGTVTDLSPLKDIVIIETEIDIYGGHLLNNLHGLHNIERVKNLKFRYNPNLTDLTGLDNLEFTSGDIQITNNSALTSLNGLNNLLVIGYKSIGSLYVQNCTNIQSLHGLENLDYVAGDVDLKGNNSLTDLTALRKVDWVYGDVDVRSNPVLRNLDGLENITYAHNIWIEDNPLLTDISALNNIDSLSITFGNVVIIGNAKLASLSCFNKISHFNFIVIKDNAILSSFQAFAQGTNVRDLDVANNPSLTNIAGVESLKIVQAVSFTQNAALSSFCPLKPLFLSLYSNPTFFASGNAQNPTKAQIISSCP